MTGPRFCQHGIVARPFARLRIRPSSCLGTSLGWIRLYFSFGPVGDDRKAETPDAKST
jgi:hypothetical protein